MKSIKIEIIFLVATLFIGFAANTNPAYGYDTNALLYPTGYPDPYPTSYPGPDPSITSLTVTKAADTDDGACDSDCSLREAIEVISRGGTINFDSSLSGQTITLASPLNIDKDLTVDGSSLSTNIQISSPIFPEGLTIGYFHDPYITLKSIDFINASLNSILQWGGTLTVVDSNFSGNVFSIHVYQGTLIVQNNEFSNNGSSGFGSGIYNEYGAVTITNSIFDNNGGEYGGCIYNYDGTLTVNKSIFSNNTARFGGGIMNISSASISDSLFINNTATENGGAIQNSGNLTVTASTFSGNVANNSGGGITSYGGLTLSDSTFSDNTAGNLGGGISVDDVDLQMTNSTFDNNSASQGGGVYFDAESYYAPSVLKNNTIASNSGGGLYINNGNLELFNNILANSITGSDCFAGSTTLLAGGNNLIENDSISPNSCEITFVTNDPLLQILADNGGYTKTMALGAGSPAIDAGDDANCPDTDQRGVTRPQGSHCDIGAYEYELPASADVNVEISGVWQASYEIPVSDYKPLTYPGTSGGPLFVENTNTNPIVSSMRLLYRNSKTETLSELMGVPTSQLSNDYWMPYFIDNVNHDSQIRFTNTHATLSTTVNVYLGDNPTPVASIALGPQAADRVNLDNTTGGPLRIESTTAGVNILAGMRIIYKGNSSFDEIMALPTAVLDDEYWFPFYNHNNVNLFSEVRVGNPTNTDTVVSIYVGNTLMDNDYLLPAHGYFLQSYPGTSGGPLRVVSNDGTNIIASMRLLYRNSKTETLSELMGVPSSQLSNDYWMPYYADDANHDSQIRFTNTHATLSTTVNVYLGDNPTPVASIALGPQAADRVTLDNTTGGPLRIESTTAGVNILAGMRIIYKGNSSFDEIMALPTAVLDDGYWFPFYNHNNVNLFSEVRIGVPDIP